MSNWFACIRFDCWMLRPIRVFPGISLNMFPCEINKTDGKTPNTEEIYRFDGLLVKRTMEGNENTISVVFFLRCIQHSEAARKSEGERDRESNTMNGGMYIWINIYSNKQHSMRQHPSQLAKLRKTKGKQQFEHVFGEQSVVWLFAFGFRFCCLLSLQLNGNKQTTNETNKMAKWAERHEK